MIVFAYLAPVKQVIGGVPQYPVRLQFQSTLNSIPQLVYQADVGAWDGVSSLAFTLAQNVGTATGAAPTLTLIPGPQMVLP